MDEIDQNLQEEHLIKGGRRVRFRNAEDSLLEVREGIHRWWWEYLRLSRDYWLICQTSQLNRPETQDASLARVFRAFGDIYNCTFDDWWLERGSRVFMEREKFPRVREIARRPQERFAHKMLEDHVWLDIPLKLSMRTIQRQISKILIAHAEERLSNRLEMSTSEFKLNPVQFRLHTLQKMHEVFTLHRELIDKPRAFKTAGHVGGAVKRQADLFRIGKLLRVSPSNEQLTGYADEVAKRQNRMRASVSRLLKRTELLIDNAERGVFPSFKAAEVLDAPRFNARQLAMHKELEPKWWALDLTSALSVGKLEEAKRIHVQEGLQMRQAKDR
jgi:hypothetical protein